jgi:hypothetical protein
MEVVSSDNTQDIGTVIKGNAQGATAITSDAGGSTTTLVDADVDFTAATAVAVGDILLLDPCGATPEWGYITNVAAHTLTCSNGFSSGGSGSTRKYSVIDASAYTGALAVLICYLDGSYVQKNEIVILNGTTAVPTINTDLYRINCYRVIATGSDYKCKGNLFLRNLSDTPVYSYILAGYTRARDVMYTVPAGKTLYVAHLNLGYSCAANQVNYCRMYTRVNMDPDSLFNTGNIFFPFSEALVSNQDAALIIPVPTKIPAKCDIKVSGIASASGVATVALRGYLVS